MLLIFTSASIPARVSGQALTSGADFLKIDNGARSQGMGGAFTGVADDVNALVWNPAGLALLEHPEVGYLRMLYLSDIAYNFGGVALPIPAGPDTMGLGAGIINLGSTFDSTLGLVPSISAGDNAFFLSFAYRVKNIVAFGITGKYIMRNIAGYSASAFGGDFGVLVTPGEHFRIGAGIFNVGQQVQFISSADPLPLTGRLGLAYQVLDIPHHSVLLALDSSYQIQGGIFQGGVGAEYWYDKTLAVRVGYTGTTDQQHLTAGIGVNINVFQVDYAYAPIGTLGDTHRLSLIVRLGAEAGEGLLAPSAFAAKPFDGGIGLSWKPAASGDVVGYNLYLKGSGGVLKRLTKRPINDTAVRFKSLKNGDNYTFVVASVSAAGRESSMVELSAAPGVVALQAPTGFKAFAEGAGVQLVWDAAHSTDSGQASGDVTGFNIYLADDQGKPTKKLKTLSDNKLILKQLNPERTYKFVLTAMDKAGGESVPTALLAVKLSDLQKTVTAGLLAPAKLVIEGGDGIAKLSWDTVQGAVGYHIYYSSDGQTFQRLTKKEPKTVPSVVLKPLKNGKTYYFGVTSVSATGEESARIVQSVVPAGIFEK